MKAKPKNIKGCESCLFRGSEIVQDPEDKETYRCYCKARFVNVDVEIIGENCDFFKVNPDYKPTKDSKLKGI